MKKKLVIFDLDGTLLDTLSDIASTANKVLEELGYKTHDEQSYKSFVGDGAKELVRRAISPVDDEKETQKAFDLFKSYYDNRVDDKTIPFDGVIPMLQELENFCDIAILSNKPHLFTLKEVKKFLSMISFQEVHGQKEELPKKPDPSGVFNILNLLDKSYEEMYFVGDTAVDMKTASASDFRSIGVTWGYQTKQRLLEHGASYIVDTPKEISEIILKK